MEKCFIKERNGYNEHEIMLSELFHDVKRKGKDFIVSTIDFEKLSSQSHTSSLCQRDSSAVSQNG
jgi:hypothetical protein